MPLAFLLPRRIYAFQIRTGNRIGVRFNKLKFSPDSQITHALHFLPLFFRRLTLSDFSGFFQALGSGFHVAVASMSTLTSSPEAVCGLRFASITATRLSPFWVHSTLPWLFRHLLKGVLKE